MSLLEDYQYLSVAVGIRFSDKYLVYNLANVLEMILSAFNGSMLIWSLPVVVPFFISHSAASTSQDIISGTSWVSVIYCTLFTVV